MRRAGAVALVGCALGAAPAQAEDTVVATTPRPTPIDAYGGHAVWSAWDPAAGGYRLVDYAGGRARTLPVAPNRVPFDADLGPDAKGRTVAVYSRCERPPATTWALGGRRGCDLRALHLSGGREFAIGSANSRADEYWPTIWGSRIAFTRTYRPLGPHRDRRLLYWRRFHSSMKSDRLDRGPLGMGDAIPEQLDLRSRRVAFTWTYEYGAELRLDTTTGHERRLVRLPGSGAAVNVLRAQGPSIVGDGVHWGLSVGGDVPVFTELRRHDLGSGADTRATTGVDADASSPQATTGFARDGALTWYVRTAGPAGYEIHRARGLAYEEAPPPALE